MKTPNYQVLNALLPQLAQEIETFIGKLCMLRIKLWPKTNLIVFRKKTRLRHFPFSYVAYDIICGLHQRRPDT